MTILNTFAFAVNALLALLMFYMGMQASPEKKLFRFAGWCAAFAAFSNLLAMLI